MKKKLLVSFLSVVWVVAMLPINIFADINDLENNETNEPEYGTHEYWEQLYPHHQHTYPLYPGERIGSNAGSYIMFINKDITVDATEEGQSGLVVDGDATIILEDDCTLTVKGGDTTTMKGAGAGIELLSGNSLRVKGTGELNVTGGKGADAGIGKPGEDADDDNSGDGGAGGNGGGGAGAAIGSPGSDGAAGGKAVDGRHEGTVWKDYPARNGNDGEDSSSAQSNGDLKISGSVKLTLNGGEPGKEPQNDEYLLGGKNDYENEGLGIIVNHSFTSFGGGGAGGFGGAGWSGAKIGLGGTGGAGGGSGSSGAIKNYYKNRKASKDDLAICGGEGGSGDSEIKENYTKLIQYYRTLGNEVSTSTAGFGGAKGNKGHGDNNSVAGNAGKRGAIGNANAAYATTLEDSERDNQEAAIRNVYPVDECIIKDVDHVISVVHIPTETILEQGKDFSLDIEETNKGLQAKAYGGKLVNSDMTREGYLRCEYNLITYTVNHHLQKLTSDGKGASNSYECVDSEVIKGIPNVMTDAKAKDYKGFTVVNIPQRIIKEDGSTQIDIFYNRNVHTLTLKEGAHGIYPQGEYQIDVCYGANIEKNLPEGYDLAEEGYRFNEWVPRIYQDAVMGDRNEEHVALWKLK